MLVRRTAVTSGGHGEYVVIAVGIERARASSHKRASIASKRRSTAPTRHTTTAMIATAWTARPPSVIQCPGSSFDAVLAMAGVPGYKAKRLPCPALTAGREPSRLYVAAGRPGIPSPVRLYGTRPLTIYTGIACRCNALCGPLHVAGEHFHRMPSRAFYQREHAPVWPLHDRLTCPRRHPHVHVRPTLRTRHDRKGPAEPPARCASSDPCALSVRTINLPGAIVSLHLIHGPSPRRCDDAASCLCTRSRSCPRRVRGRQR